MTNTVTVRRFPRVAYEPCWQAMKAFTEQRDDNTPDELWALEHPPVFTLGQAGKPEHVLAPGEIPVVRCDRGGQVTYHGPGQTVIYLMLDLKRHGIGARELVTRIENAIVAMLAARGIDAWPKKEAPGVYTEQGKIASLGLRIRRARSYHGLALNRDLDVEDIFRRINPCGHVGQPVTTLARLGTDASARGVEDDLLAALTENFPGTRLEEASALPDWYNASHDNASLEHS